eukprot:Rmarinus@m.9938
MTERKVINKYYPPDFDPAKIPRNRKPRDMQVSVRIMLPMSINCITCGEWMARGTKFNSRKEMVLTEDYLGIRIFRFYIKCRKCHSEITFKTDPENADYICEHGASRCAEPWKEREALTEEARMESEEAERDVMMLMEKRTRESKAEMDALDALDELRAINARNVRVNTDDLLHSLQEKTVAKRKRDADTLCDEDEAEVKRFFGPGGVRKPLSPRLTPKSPSTKPKAAKSRNKAAKPGAAAEKLQPMSMSLADDLEVDGSDDGG